MKDVKRYKHSPEHLKQRFLNWWERRKEFGKISEDHYFNDKIITDADKTEIIKQGYALIGECYMIARAFRDRWEAEGSVSKDYDYYTYDNIINHIQLIEYDLDTYLNLDPYTDEYKEKMDKLLKVIFNNETEAEKNQESSN